MSRVNLTDQLIKNQKAGGGRREFWDDRFTGGSFGLRVTDSGHRSFVVMYRIGGRLRRMTLGVYPALSLADARKDALKAVADVARGIDPQEEKLRDRKTETFKQLGKLYLERHARIHKKPRSAKEDERMLKVYLYPSWGNRKMTDIARRHVVEVLDAIATKREAPIMANRVRALVHKVFNFALARDLIPFNPAAGVPRPAKDVAKDTTLSDDQIRELYTDLEKREEPTPSIFRLILLTGQRPGEVKQMKWTDLNGDVWHIPAEVAKNGREHFVPLSNQTLDVIEKLRTESEESEWVFASPQGGHIEWLQSMANRMNKSLSFHFAPHDLRRTCGTGMAQLGIHREVIAKVLNHKSADNTVTAVYDRYDRIPEMRQALERWGARVEAVLKEKSQGR